MNTWLIMEVDNEVDGKLLQQFSSLGTTDREVLVNELHKLLGDQLNYDGCVFFLDMNNWNLQAAVGAYYDFDQPNIKLPLMALIKDATVGEGESVAPNTRFTKTWKIQNTGDELWPIGCSLQFVAGERFGHHERVPVEPVAVGSFADITVEMLSPAVTGMYQGQWRMCTLSGMFFGEIIWVIVQVEESGLLGVTQQMSQFGVEFSRSGTNMHNSEGSNLSHYNPFGYPASISLPSSPREFNSATVNHYNYEPLILPSSRQIGVRDSSPPELIGLVPDSNHTNLSNQNSSAEMEDYDSL